MNISNFHTTVLKTQHAPLTALEIAVLQVNMGYRCNLSCKHCHVEGGPSRREMMDQGTVGQVLKVLADTPISTLDITGGAPELNPHFRGLVQKARGLGKKVIVRTNLAVFFEHGMEGLPGFFRDHEVELVASLPYYLEDDVDRVRGSGVFRKSMEAFRKLNSLGYGLSEALPLCLVYNPRGAFLSPDQTVLEQEYKKELFARFGVSFTRLYTFTNMPIGRFLEFLKRSNNLAKYLDKLTGSFNPATLDNIMCRHLISVGWDGKLADCDFNQAMGLTVDSGAPAHLGDFDLDRLTRRTISVGDHCFACTAGAGSS